MNQRLLNLLDGCVMVIHEMVTTDARVAEEPLNEYLESANATALECLWLGPRISAYAAGYANGHAAGQVHRDGCLWQHPQEHIDTRRN